MSRAGLPQTSLLFLVRSGQETKFLAKHGQNYFFPQVTHVPPNGSEASKGGFNPLEKGGSLTKPGE